MGEDVCPHCRQRMLIRHGARLPVRLADMFTFIENAGDRGVPMQVMIDVFYPGVPEKKARNRVRVNVHHMNGFLAETLYSVGAGGPGLPYRVWKEQGAQ